MQRPFKILKSVLTIMLLGMALVSQSALPLLRVSQNAEKAVGGVSQNAEDDASDAAPKTEIGQGSTFSAIVPLGKLQLQTAYFLVRQLFASLPEGQPVTMPDLPYRDQWMDVVYPTVISPQAP